MEKFENGIKLLDQVIKQLGNTQSDVKSNYIFIQSSIAYNRITMGIKEAISDDPSRAKDILELAQNHMIMLFRAVLELGIVFSNEPAYKINYINLQA